MHPNQALATLEEACRELKRQKGSGEPCLRAAKRHEAGRGTVASGEAAQIFYREACDRGAEEACQALPAPR